MEAHCVLCEVRTEFLHLVYILVFKRLTDYPYSPQRYHQTGHNCIPPNPSVLFVHEYIPLPFGATWHVQLSHSRQTTYEVIKRSRLPVCLV
jgi:hypothetical protein